MINGQNFIKISEIIWQECAFPRSNVDENGKLYKISKVE